MTFLKHGLTRWLVSLSVGLWFFLFLTNNCTAFISNQYCDRSADGKKPGGEFGGASSQTARGQR